VVGDGEGDGLWEIEGLVLKAVAPIRTPTTPVMISFCMTKEGDSSYLRVPLSSLFRISLTVQEFRSSGVQEFRSSGVQEFRSSGVQEAVNHLFYLLFYSYKIP
jgi:hypothetical protein